MAGAPKGEYVEAAGVRAYCLSAGQGEAVLLLHGLGASSYSWRHMWAHLSPGYRCIAPDWPGFARSDKPLDFDYSVDGFSTWLIALMDRLGIQKAHLVGNSMGGMCALGTALRFPDRVGKIALFGTPVYPKNRPMLLWPLRWPVIGRVYEFFLGAWAVPFVARSVFRDSSLVTPEMIEEYAFGLREPGGRRAVAQFIRRCVPSDVNEIMEWYRRIPNPTLVLVGDHDLVVDAASAERFSKEAPKASFLCVSECGHAPQEEKPEETGKALRGFLDGCRPGK